MVFKVWTVDQRPQHHLGNKVEMQGFTSHLLSQKHWGSGPPVYASKHTGDSNAVELLCWNANHSNPLPNALPFVPTSFLPPPSWNVGG